MSKYININCSINFREAIQPLLTEKQGLLLYTSESEGSICYDRILFVGPNVNHMVNFF